MTGRQLATIRKNLGLSQEEMAELMAVTAGVIVSQWENCYRNPSKIIKKLYGLLDQLPKNDTKKLIQWLRVGKTLGAKKTKK